MLPASLLTALCLLFWRGRRTAACWAVAVCGVLGTMLVLKLSLGACGDRIGLSMLESPSGHTASATMLYGGLATLLLPRLSLPVSLLVAVVIAALFGTSRVVLGDHTLPEVLLGACVGLCGVTGFAMSRRPEPTRENRLALIAMLAVIVFLVHGQRLPAERELHSFAITQLRALVCPAPAQLPTL